MAHLVLGSVRQRANLRGLHLALIADWAIQRRRLTECLTTTAATAWRFLWHEHVTELSHARN